MESFDAWFLPDGERHMQDWMTKKNQRVEGRLTYQYHKYEAALSHCRHRGVALDVGAHVGFFSYWLARDFTVVHAFEPVAAFRECWTKNMERRGGVLYPYAIGAQRGKVSMKIPAMGDGIDSGGTHVSGDGDVDMRTIDEFEFDGVAYLKIDCEGYEHHVIAGARETLIRCRPCVIVEQKQHIMGRNFGIQGTPAVDMLVEMGAKVVREMGGDYILTWPS